jgi:hypothetical protein
MPAAAAAQMVTNSAKLGIFTMLEEQARCFEGAIQVSIPNMMGPLEQERTERELIARGMFEPPIRHFRPSRDPTDDEIVEAARTFQKSSNRVCFFVLCNRHWFNVTSHGKYASDAHTHTHTSVCPTHTHTSDAVNISAQTFQNLCEKKKERAPTPTFFFLNQMKRERANANTFTNPVLPAVGPVMFKDATGHFTESGRAATTVVRPNFEYMRGASYR